MSSQPIVPPRPVRSQEKDNGAAPTIPARPTKRFNRSVSPNPDRFAPSPLNESPFAPKAKRNSQSLLGEELERSTSVDLPGVGEEGKEYAVALEELRSTSPEEIRTSSPEQTRSVDEGLKLHAPKPTVPAASAEKRVAAVTRTDSDRAAAFGIGRPSSEEPLHSGARSLKKKASTTSQLSHHSELITDDEHGIPEIGQRVPMLSYAGDVQAPSPAPPRASSVDSTKSGRHHTRRTSSRSGFHDLPPGSYGLHGHGVESTDKLQKAYYEKHPEIYQKEHYHPLHERAHDYSMSSENLNKIVRDTASRGAGFGTSGYIGTPSEQVGFQASDEYTSRISSPQPSSAAPKAEPVNSSTETIGDNVIHVDEDAQYKAFVKYGDGESAEDRGVHNDGSWPVLAADEVAKDPSPYELQPAIPPNRRGSDEPRSRPSSRPASIYSPPPPEVRSTPLEDVEEYEPLFPEDEKGDQKPKTAAEKLRESSQRFPSRDIWEDAPNSVHSTAEVSTPEPPNTRPKSRTVSVDLPPRDTETPAQAFARRQEELAEKEAVTPDSFLNRQQRPKSWVEHQPHLAKEIRSRPNTGQRFPSRDVWEDTPDSLQFTTTVSSPQSADDLTVDEETKPQPPANRPSIPTRPPKKQGSGDDGTLRPVIPNRPKPHIPARPVKPTADDKEPEGAPKQKPLVPARPVGGKIAALQAGFMSDLNNRLRLGPQAPPKKEAPPDEVPEEKEKAPLADARKGRARGPQRRAPTKSSGTEKSAPPPVSNGHPVLSFSMTRTLWSIDEEGTVMVDNFGPEKAKSPESTVKEVEPEVDEVKPADEVKPEGDEAKPEAKEAEPAETQPDQTQVEGTEAVETKSEETPEQKEPEKIIENAETTETTEPTTVDDKPSETQDTVEETKSLVTNTAGEPVLTETVEKKEGGDEVKEVEEVKDEVKS
ncbi:altered inheritance of mitochondria protein 21 [Xylaria sp. FL0064]|nr:altered inheritance of mitochondria protein 21 [Xylaria sp. FL0064]